MRHRRTTGKKDLAELETPDPRGHTLLLRSSEANVARSGRSRRAATRRRWARKQQVQEGHSGWADVSHSLIVVAFTQLSSFIKSHPRAYVTRVHLPYVGCDSMVLIYE